MYRNLSPGALGIRCSWEEGLDLAARAGFQGADVNIGDAAQLAEQHGIDGVRALLAERGLQPGGWGFPVRWNGSDAEFERSLAELPAQAALAAALGCFRTMTWVPPSSDDMPRTAFYTRFVERFRACAEVLDAHGQRLGLEFIGPRTLRAGKKHGFVHTMDGMLMLCSAIGTGNVGLLFDVWHWYTCRSTVDDVRQLTVHDVVYVHMNDAPAGVDVLDQVDNVRCLPGETGVIPNGELLRILDGLGYEGPVTVEPFNQPLRDLAARNPLAAAIRTRESLDLVFRQAGLE